MNNLLQQNESAEEKWQRVFQELQHFLINNDGSVPSQHRNQEEKRLFNFFCHNRQMYLNNSGMMAHQQLRMQWENLRVTYPRLFETAEEKWQRAFQELQQFLVNNDGSAPSQHRNQEEKRLFNFFCHNRQMYLNNSGMMAHQQLRMQWENLRVTYPRLFETAEENWQRAFQELQQFVENHQRLPRRNLRNEEETRLFSFLNRNRQMYYNETGTMAREQPRMQLENLANRFTDISAS
jgi:hemerythrin-like domain-containing protein